MLAQEINRLTGWQIVAFGAYPDRVHEAGQCTLGNLDWSHVLVRTPDGRYLDVLGVADADVVELRYVDGIEAFYDWCPEYVEFEDVTTAEDWAALSIHYRIFPQADAHRVAERLILDYTAEITLAA